MNSHPKMARLAGLLYLLMGITAAFGVMYIPTKIVVRADAVATASNILANEFLFRLGIASHLISVTIFIGLVLVLYRLFRPVSDYQAKLMVALVLVQIPIAFVVEVCRITALMILKGEVVKTLAPEQLPELAMLFLKMHGYGIAMLELFWGLWLIPFGQLIYKSGYMPSLWGLLLLMAGIAYIVDSFTFVIFPTYSVFVKLPTLILASLGEVSTILWLLFKGVKASPLN